MSLSNRQVGQRVSADVMTLQSRVGQLRNVVFRAAVWLAICLTFTFGSASALPTTVGSYAQAEASGALNSEYEVASIKVTKSSSANGVFRMGMQQTPDGFSAENISLKLLIQTAYGVGKDRISGGPDWIDSDRYDIDAKMEISAADELKKLRPDQLMLARQHMLQALLADRFKLAVHRENKEVPVYLLVIAKNGPKIQESKPVDPGSKETAGLATGGMPGRGTTGGGPGVTGWTFERSGLRSASATDSPIAALVEAISAVLGRPVFDRTGLTGKYDYKLQWSEESPAQMSPGGSPNGSPELASPDSGGPSIFTALQDQLGLKLESGKGPVEVIVIDHTQKPSGN